MRSAACSGASQTIVMRETPSRSLSPTVSETMLTLRRRKREATRVNTPGLSSTRATKVWSMRAFRLVLQRRRIGRVGVPELGFFFVVDEDALVPNGISGVGVVA